MPSKKKPIKITKTPPSRFMQSAYAHEYLNVKQFTVFKTLGHDVPVYVKQDGEFHKVSFASVKIVDFNKITNTPNADKTNNEKEDIVAKFCDMLREQKEFFDPNSEVNQLIVKRKPSFADLSKYVELLKKHNE